jgi:Xaa-Pro aminopeptidase
LIDLGPFTREGDQVFDYAARRRRLTERMHEEGISALFLAPSADLEYLTGVERQVPNFGEVSYAHGWVTGAFIRREGDPIFFFPRMFAAFDVPVLPAGEIVIVNETDDARAALENVVGGLEQSGVVAVGDRVWAEAFFHLGHALGYDRLRLGTSIVNELRRVKDPDELAVMRRAIEPVERAMAAATPVCVPGTTMGELVEVVEHEMRRGRSRCPSFTTHMFTGFEPGAFDSGLATAWDPVPEGTSVMFDFGGVVDGYCSDFGRTVYCGEAPAEVIEAYAVLMEAYEAGRAAAVPGALARDVNAACRAPIEAAGYGEHFRHRMGHGIGMNVHERPFLSEEDETPLRAGMTFTDEPSIMIPDRFSIRIENIIVCADGGGETLNSYPDDLVSSSAAA